MNEPLAAKLRKIPLFKDLAGNDKAIQSILEKCSRIHLKQNQVIFIEGSRDNKMYIPLSGNYEVLKKTREGDSYTVTRLRAEDPIFFGEIALIDDENRSATVVATSDGECLVLEKTAFEDLAKKHPEWALPIVRQIAHTLATRLRKTTADMLTLFDALVEEIKN